MREDVDLLCEYCGTAISLDDKNCPNCGANCSKIIKKYKDEQRKIKENQEQRTRELQENITNAVLSNFSSTSKLSVIVTFIIAVIFIFIAISFIVIMLKPQKEFSFDSHSDGSSTFSQKKVNAKYNELAKGKKFSIILDSYELYDHKSDDFPNVYNTKDGYQKIAFHFVVTNTSKNMISVGTYGGFGLTADDSIVDSANLDVCVFCYAAQGKANYEKILGQMIDSGSKLKGYVGYEVPKDKKKLKFTIEDIVITMDNPAYQN